MTLQIRLESQSVAAVFCLCIASESVNCVVTYFLYITQVPATLPPVHAVCRSVTSIVYIRWRDFFRQCSSFVGNLTDTSLRCLSIARCLFSLRFYVDLSIVAVRFEWPSANFYSTTPQFIGDQIWTTAWCSSIDARSPCSNFHARLRICSNKTNLIRRLTNIRLQNGAQAYTFIFSHTHSSRHFDSVTCQSVASCLTHEVDAVHPAVGNWNALLTSWYDLHVTSLFCVCRTRQRPRVWTSRSCHWTCHYAL